MHELPPPIDSQETFAAAVRWGVDAALAQDARTMTWVDPTFAGWPLDDVELIRQLTAWLRLPQRRLVLLAADYNDVPRRQPRFTVWRRDWAHAIQPMQCPPEFAQTLPSVLLDDRRVSVNLLDAMNWRGRASLEVRTRLLLQEKVDVVLQRSEPGFAVTTLGL